MVWTFYALVVILLHFNGDDYYGNYIYDNDINDNAFYGNDIYGNNFYGKDFCVKTSNFYIFTLNPNPKQFFKKTFEHSLSILNTYWFSINVQLFMFF